MERGIVAKAILKRKQNKGFIRAKEKRHNNVGALQKKKGFTLVSLYTVHSESSFYGSCVCLQSVIPWGTPSSGTPCTVLTLELEFSAKTKIRGYTSVTAFSFPWKFHVWNHVS